MVVLQFFFFYYFFHFFIYKSGMFKKLFSVEWNVQSMIQNLIFCKVLKYWNLFL